MYILRCLANDLGDFEVGRYNEKEEVLLTQWSFKNLDEYKKLVNDERPYFYVVKII